jgi:hypothetical protein
MADANVAAQREHRIPKYWPTDIYKPIPQALISVPDIGVVQTSIPPAQTADGGEPTHCNIRPQSFNGLVAKGVPGESYAHVRASATQKVETRTRPATIACPSANRQ